MKSAIAVGAARVADQVKAKLEIKDTGNAKIDAMGDVFNAKLALFTDAPPPEQGALGWVNKGVQVAMAVKDFTAIGQELMDTGFAMATAGIAAMMPALPAAFLTVPHLGMPHAHAHPPSLVPPAPPVPLPSIGTLMLAGSVGVLIMGMPAGRCGDLGLAMTCGSLSPAFDVFLGSSNTFIAGNRAARMGDMTRHCNPASAALAVSRGAALFSAAVGIVGVAADAVGGSPVMGAVAQIAADLAAAAMSALLGKDPGIPPAFGALMLGAPTVLIGGFPCPNLPNPLDALMHGLKCLGKAIGKSKGFGKLISKVGLCNDPGEPISSFTGDVYNTFEDYLATDSSFRWERHYRSGWNEQDGPLGYGFRHFFQRTLLVRRKRVIYETHDNELVALARRDDGTYAAADGFSLALKDGGYFELDTDRNEHLLFEPVPSVPASYRLSRYRAEGVEVYCYYDSVGRLRALTEQGADLIVDTQLAYDVDGHIEQLNRGARGQSLSLICRYVYRDGCLIEWHDALGATARMRYDGQHRMVQGTDRRGYSFHWEYDPASGKCIKSGGDDGLWGVEASYRGTSATFTEPDGNAWTYKHYPDGKVSHLVDPLGGVTQYIKGDDGKVVAQILPSGVKVEWLYANDGKLVHRRDQWSNLLPPEDEAPNLPDPLAYDGPELQRDCLLGRPLKLRRRQLAPIPSAIQRALAQLGPIHTTGNPAPRPKKDLLGRVVEQTHRDGAKEYFHRDAEGNVTAHLDTNGHWWLKHVTSWNLLGAEKSPTGAVNQYAYNHRELRRTWIDGNGNRSDYSFDRAQRVSELAHQGAASTILKRDPSGAVVEKQSRDGVALVQHALGRHGLRIATLVPGHDEYSFDYDKFGNCTDASSGKHQVKREHLRRYFFHAIPYRSAERIDGKGIRHGYDSSREVEHSVYFERFAVEYRSLKNGRLRVFTPAGGTHDFYLALGGEHVRENGNGTIETSVFDAEDRLCARLCTKSDKLADSPHWVTRYRYNAEGELIEQTDTDTGPVRYAYDPDHRLVGQFDARGQREYGYDPAGNLTRAPGHRVIERLSGNLLAFTDTEKFEYDAQSRLSKRTRYDGRIVNYAYDGLGQLVEATFSDTESVWRAGYDGLGRRIWREYGGERTCFHWDGDRLAAEIAPDGKLRIYVYANTDALVPFMWLDYDSVGSAPEAGRAFYMFTHGTGMPTRVEDRLGEVVWRANYIDAYGLMEVEEGASVELRLRFTGHFHDEHTGLFYNRYRDYEPSLGRYLQPDPIDLAGGINLYSYPANPVVDVDLRGLFHKKQPKPLPEGAEKPPHHGKPLESLTDVELQEVCKFHADALAVAQDPRPGAKNRNTFAVGAIRDADGNVHLVATSNRNLERKPNEGARAHMEQHGLHDAHDAKPRITKDPEKGNVNLDNGNQPHDKRQESNHHAEQKMNNLPDEKKGETLVAQSPSQGCCGKCNHTLSQPDSRGQKPIDKVPPDRRSR
jgi:RHS repeat-associated protein